MRFQGSQKYEDDSYLEYCNVSSQSDERLITLLMEDLLNVSLLLWDYMAQYPRRLSSSYSK
jgi:hypothetical protein